MDKVFILLQESNVDGEIIINVTPCADLDSAKAVMKKEINTLLREGEFSGVDLNEIEECQNEEDTLCDYTLERTDDSFYISCIYDDYYEKLDIIEKEVVKM